VARPSRSDRTRPQPRERGRPFRDLPSDWWPRAPARLVNCGGRRHGAARLRLPGASPWQPPRRRVAPSSPPQSTTIGGREGYPRPRARSHHPTTHGAIRTPWRNEYSPDGHVDHVSERDFDKA